MGYYIIKNQYAPKIAGLDLKKGVTNSHAILVNYCNFKCKYCCIDYAGRKLYRDYTAEEFEEKIKELLALGKYFKFSGGEPTLNPLLKRDIKIVKEQGGIVFLDTNGSRAQIIFDLLDSHLIDVLGISLKGIDAKSAQNNSGCVDGIEAWDNVFSSIEYAVKHNVRVIITYVLFDNTTYEMMNDFVHLFPEKSVYIKFNNYKSNGDGKLKKMSSDNLKKNIERLLKENLWLKDYVIIISDEGAVSDYSKIDFC